MNRTLLLSLFAAGFLLALTACGGGTSSESAQPTPTSANRTAPKATTSPKRTAPKANATTSAKTSSKRSAPTSTSSTKTTGNVTAPAPAPAPTKAKAPGLPASECHRLNVLAGKMGQAFNGRNPAADTKAYAAYLQQLAKTAPTDIRGDFGVLADAYTQVADAVAAVYSKPGATSDPDQLQKLTDVGRELNTAAIKDAADNVNAWLQTNCAR